MICIFFCENCVKLSWNKACFFLACRCFSFSVTFFSFQELTDQVYFREIVNEILKTTNTEEWKHGSLVQRSKRLRAITGNYLFNCKMIWHWFVLDQLFKCQELIQYDIVYNRLYQCWESYWQVIYFILQRLISTSIT